MMLFINQYKDGMHYCLSIYCQKVFSSAKKKVQHNTKMHKIIFRIFYQHNLLENVI